MRFCIVLMSAIVLFMLAGVTAAPSGEALPYLFKSPLFIALGFVLGIANLVAVIKRWNKPGFVLMHLGITVLLTGAFIGYVNGKKGSMTVGLNHPPVNQMQLDDGSKLQIPVRVEALEFNVEYYSPVYTRDVFKGGQQAAGDIVLNVDAAEVQVEGYGPVAVDDFRMGRLWLPRVVLEDGSVLVRQSLTPKKYETKLRFDGEIEAAVIINYPVTYKGWRFYLMSYDQRTMRYVVLSARYDPGRPLVVAGIWMVIVGSFVSTFFPGGRHA
ncbi:cytochrome c biogenesis protein ResB [Verrucomicrobiota bacterium]